MQKMFCMFLAGAILAVSSIPMLPAQAAGASPSSSCSMCHMSGGGHMQAMMAMADKGHSLPPAMRHCRIECCYHHDVGGLPHLLAPHAVALAGFGIAFVMMDAANVSIPVLKPRLLPFPVPPPRYI